MQHRNASVELGLHIGVAGCRKGHCAELLVLLADCVPCQGCSDKAGRKQYACRVSARRKSPLHLHSHGARTCSTDRHAARLFSSLHFPGVRLSCKNADRRRLRGAKLRAHQCTSGCPKLPFIFRIRAEPPRQLTIRKITPASVSSIGQGDFLFCALARKRSLDQL
jgi:hypothetical protein